jgi:dienelactone hydrolase
MIVANNVLLYIILLLSFNRLSISFYIMSRVVARGHSKVSASNSAITSEMVWTPLKDLMNTSNPSELCTGHPRLAKDDAYASAVLDAWRKDASTIHSKEGYMSMGSTSTYHPKNDQTKTLYGYIVMPSQFLIKEQKEDAPRELLAIILFHTGAGPQDIFLRWKADMLIRELKDCVVFIADIICDEDGYAWSDREKYEQSRKYVLARYKEEHGRIARMNLRHYVAAAIEHLKSLNFVRISDIAAMGYCMGGHPILELGLMQDDSIKALITYHGVFDGIKDYDLPPEDELVDTTIRSWDSKSTKVLICNGKEDPFVDQDDVQKAKILLEKKGCDVRVLNFEHVRHGFTNPAQDYNPSDAFAYNDFAAKDSWDSTIQLLKDVF